MKTLFNYLILLVVALVLGVSAVAAVMSWAEGHFWEGLAFSWPIFSVLCFFAPLIFLVVATFVVMPICAIEDKIKRGKKFQY